MKQDRKFELVLYPDSNSYDCMEVIEKAKKFFSLWAFILHDKDIDDDGVIKKAHYHFIGKRESVITPKGVCYNLGIEETSLAQIRKWSSAVRYLVHADHGKKYQYEHSEVYSNFNFEEFFNESGETDEVGKILDFVFRNPRCSYRQLSKYVLDNNLWASYRRSYTIIKDIRSELSADIWFEESKQSIVELPPTEEFDDISIFGGNKS